MKKALLYSAFAMAALTTATSCSDSFLTLDPVGAVSENTLANDEGIVLLLSGAYASLYSQDGHNWDMGYKGLSNWIFGDMLGGDANKGSMDTDQPDATALENWAIVSSNDYLINKWTAVYEGVKRANNVLKVAELMEDGTQYAAEARLIKGLHMFEAIKIFGASAPYVSLEEYMANTDPLVTNVDENGNLIYIWDKVAEDLQFAADNLPDSYNGDMAGHLNKWAAKAVLAKLYLYKSSPYSGVESNGANDASALAKAKSLLDEIIANGKTSDGQKYALVSSFADLYTPAGDWTTENVFDVQHIITGTEWYPATINGSHAPYPTFLGGWGFYQPSYDFVSNFLVDENGLPDTNYRNRPEVPLVKEVSTGVESDLTTAVDPRLDLSVSRFGVPLFDHGVVMNPNDPSSVIRQASYAGYYLSKKYLPMASEVGRIGDCPGATNKNLHVIRFGEVLLMRAEVAAREGDAATAMNYINQIRKRAGDTSWWVTNDANPHTAQSLATGGSINNAAANYKIGLYDASNFGDPMTAVQREYRLEIGMEGNRWFDLARWGKIDQELNAYASFERRFFPTKYSNQYNVNWICLPIPFTEISKAQGRLVQNAVWK